MANRVCPIHGTEMDFREGIGRTGKPYAMYKCSTKGCKEIEWINDKSEALGAAKGTPKPPANAPKPFTARDPKDTLLNTCLLTAKDIVLKTSKAKTWEEMVKEITDATNKLFIETKNIRVKLYDPRINDVSNIEFGEPV